MLKWRTPKGAQLQQCAKVALAAIAAYFLTLGGRNDFALFSVMGAALVVGGSVGEDLSTSVNRVRGTLAGTVVGIVCAYTIGASIWSLAIAVAVLAWICIGFGWGTAAMRVGIAMALVVVFTHTSDAAAYGGWRLLNTLIGVCVGIGVSRLVWPIRGRDEIARAIDRSLDATHALLDSLAGGGSGSTLTPRQTSVLDTLSAIRTARQNALLERRINPSMDMLTTHVLAAAHAGVAALGASIKLDELVGSTVRPECVQAIRQAIAPLAAYARDPMTSEYAAGNFAALHDYASREAAHPDLDRPTRLLLAALLGELQQLHAALRDIRDARARQSSV